jgi:thiamine biosynthesis lipoprotein
LIHGGTSSVYGLGHPPEHKAWRVALEIPTALLSKESPPPMRGEDAAEWPDAISSDRPKRLPVAVVELNGLSLSVSACWGKSFEREGRTYGHVLDPGTGAPAANAIMAAIVTPSASDGDALSTALLVRGASAQTGINRLRPETSSFVATATESEILLEGLGISSLHGPAFPRTQGA